MKPREILATGKFNSMSQEEQVDGSVIITLTKRGDNLTYKLQVRNLYQANEVVQWEKVSESDQPSY